MWGETRCFALCGDGDGVFLVLLPLLPLLGLLPCSPALWQSKVLVSVSVGSPDLFHMVLRYTSWLRSDVVGKVSVIKDSWNIYCDGCKCRRDETPVQNRPTSSPPACSLLTPSLSAQASDVKFLLRNSCERTWWRCWWARRENKHK